MTTAETIRIMSERIFRALKLDKSVYNEVKDDPGATAQSVLMPFIIEVVLLVIGGIAVLPLWFIYGPWTIGGTPIQIATGILIFIVASIFFVFVPFIIWVLVLFLMGKFVGSKDIQGIQVLRVTGFAFSHALLYVLLFIAIVYTAVGGGGIAVAVIAVGGGILIGLLLFVSNVLSFREVANVTTGVSILANIFAFVVFGLIFAGVAVGFGLAIAGLAGVLFP
ncbi:MAG: hypothetical protein ACFFCD_00010 [Promethearchaeota archaeon]